MKKTALQKKWEKIGNEPGWVEDNSPETRAKVLARNAKIRAERESKSATINTRIAPTDLDAFKKIADDKAIPYQTLLGHVLHEYVSGNLIDVKEAKKLFKIKAG
jgi:predicted DNA binding CopG/RHH family protein